jgi:hypothetical protein
MTFPVTFQKTFRENWPPELVKLSLPAMSFALLPHEMDFMGQWQEIYKRYYNPAFTQHCPSLDIKLEQAFSWKPELFPRLSFCSWRSLKGTGAPCRTLQDFLSMIGKNDERIDSYLTAAKAQFMTVCLHLLEWRNMNDFDEVRLFIRSNELLGASSYHEDMKSPITLQRARDIAFAVKSFRDLLIRHLPLESVIVDCLIPKRTSYQPQVLELNPFASISSPGHFSWDEKFDFQLRTLHHQLQL